MPSLLLLFVFYKITVRNFFSERKKQTETQDQIKSNTVICVWTRMKVNTSLLIKDFGCLIIIPILIVLILQISSVNSRQVYCERDSNHLHIHCGGALFEAKEHLEDEIPTVLLDIGISIILILMAGVASGLTIGLLSLDPVTLNVLQSSDFSSPKEKLYAQRILPLIENRNLLLVTLLVLNAFALETLPIFLDKLIPSTLAVVVSVIVVLFFGEIIPQALCMRYGLAIGGNTAYAVRILVLILLPITYPISKILDFVLTNKTQTYVLKRAHLKELLHLHNSRSILSLQELNLINSAIDMFSKTVGDKMTPIADVFMLDANSTIDLPLLSLINKANKSRIPIFEGQRSNIIGGILTKKLLYSKIGSKLGESLTTELPVYKKQEKMYVVLNGFETGKSHMALVIDDGDNAYDADQQGVVAEEGGGGGAAGEEVSGKIIGIITLEDVIQELIHQPDTNPRSSNTEEV